MRTYDKGKGNLAEGIFRMEMENGEGKYEEGQQEIKEKRRELGKGCTWIRPTWIR